MTCSLDPDSDYKSAPGLEKKQLKLVKILCLSIDLHLTKDNLGVKMLSSKNDLKVKGNIYIGHQRRW